MGMTLKRSAGICMVFFLILLLSACGESGTGRKAKNGGESERSLPDTGKNLEKPGIQSGEGARLLYMGQASIRIVTAEGRVIYIDPYAGSGYDLAADLILVTHGHYDHNGVEKVENRNPDCQTITWKEAIVKGKHQTFDLDFVTVEAVEAGCNKWHDVKECVGYVLALSDGISVYVTGDTSTTEQMPDLAEKKIDYAFYCCDGVFNMDIPEAEECAKMVKAQHNIPYHVLAEDGVYFDRERAEKFNVENRLIIDENEEIRLVNVEN